jgi:hypothetical protein
MNSTAYDESAHDPDLDISTLDRGRGSAWFADEWSTQQLVVRFTANFDAGEHSQMAEDFAPNAVWYQALGPIHGRDELRTRMTELPPDLLMRHVLTNLRTTFLGRDEAVVDSYVTVYLQDRLPQHDAAVPTHGAKHLGRYRDRLRRIDGRWLLDERRVTFDFRLPDPPVE